jgi:hypothetical protein
MDFSYSTSRSLICLGLSYLTEYKQYAIVSRHGKLWQPEDISFSPDWAEKDGRQWIKVVLGASRDNDTVGEFKNHTKERPPHCLGFTVIRSSSFDI